MPPIVLSLVLISTLSSAAQPVENVRSLLSALAAPATTVDAGNSLIALGKSQPHARYVVGRELPVMLLQTKNIPVVQSEAKVAGALKLTSTIPSLIQLLSWWNGDKNTTMYDSVELLDDPVARALYEIGRPALPALREALKSQDLMTRQRVETILVLSNTAESRVILKEHLPFETNEYLRRYLKARGITSK